MDSALSQSTAPWQADESAGYAGMVAADNRMSVV